MKIVCDACQAKYSIADDKIQGKAFKIRCKKCNHIIVVKTSGENVAASSGAPFADKPRSGAALAPAPAAAPADQAMWHVVVDGEQVGPLTEAEVKDRLRQGKINSDTLAWKEGFADWMQLSTVPELTAILARITRHPVAKPAAREPARASNSMRAVETAPVESDPFGAPTVITPAGTADLFASAAGQAAVPAPVAPAPSSPFLFGGGAPQANEAVVIRNPGNGAGSTQLTGQRNENSVLFSLSNLEALAVPSRSAGIRPPSGTSTTEGSGLIDIRSMAAMTLNDGGPGDFRRGTDSLPTFSTPQFSPVAPVLLPMSTSGPPKWVYPVLALLGVGILVLGYGIYKIVAAPPPGQPVVVAAPPPPPPPPVAPLATQPGAAVPAPTPTAEGTKPATAEAKPSAEEKPQEKSDKGKGDKGKGDKGHRKSSETALSKGSGDSKKASEPAASPTSPTGAATAGTKPSGKKGGGKSLDDLLGEVGSKKGAGEEKPAPAAVKLITLTQSDIVNAMKGVQPKVQACANQFKVPGTAMANIGVATGGKVNTASVTGKFAGTPTGTCVEAAAKAAKFPPCQSMAFPWPFTLSPR
jgi:predicted Zn finger-like uncharacterized protein